LQTAGQYFELFQGHRSQILFPADRGKQYALENGQLHLDIVDRPGAIDRLDVENRELVLLEILALPNMRED
jgi:hypothetical protein